MEEKIGTSEFNTEGTEEEHRGHGEEAAAVELQSALLKATGGAPSNSGVGWLNW